MTYLVICKLDNGNVIPAIVNDFETALETVKMFNSGDFTKEVNVITLETGATSKFIL